MKRPLDRSAVMSQLEGVADRLAAPRLTAERRLALLRRQAHLGDLRDAIAKRARRDSERRMGADL